MSTRDDVPDRQRARPIDVLLGFLLLPFALVANLVWRLIRSVVRWVGRWVLALIGFARNFSEELKG